MRRFAGEAFNNIRPLQVQDLPDIDVATADDLPKIIARNFYIDEIENKEHMKRRKVEAASEAEKQKFGFNPKINKNTNSFESELQAYKNWVRRESVDLGDDKFLNIAPERLNDKIHQLQGDLEAQVREGAQKELMKLVKRELFNRRALDNEAQSFNNMMERGLINAPISENRLLGKRREKERMDNIAFLREEIQEEDRLAELRMQKAADKYFGRTPPPKQSGNGLWEGAPLVPDFGDIPF